MHARTLLVILMLALGAAPLAEAQRGPAANAPGIEELTEALELTAEQRPEIEALMNAQRERMQELRQRRSAGEIDRREMLEEAARLREENRAELEKVLDEKQLARLDELREQRRAEMRERRGGRGPGRSRPDGEG